MRKYHKTQCLELLSSIDEAGKQIADHIAKKKTEVAIRLLEDCQEAAIQLGTIIDELEGEGTEAVRILEEYCEQVYQIREELVNGRQVNARPTEKKLLKMTARVSGEIRNGIPTRYEAVFLPYKVSMWDSLESIWMAANEDPNCDAYVVPIPYYDRDSAGNLAQMHYEADRYPDYVPVIDYSTYSFEERHPEMVYIHNPYDQYNYVTSVHPDYYSYNLKNYTDCLVYVPYFATAGNMGEGQALQLSYFYVDYIIVQSEQMMGFFDPEVPREKLLPFGSPKFDKIIHTCENPPEPPAGWEEKMKGKRVFFYNTSINGFLEDTPRFLKKMEYVFNTFLNRNDACLIWRPHPLLETTIDSMRPEIKPIYEDLKRQFVQMDVGILDETPEIESTIAQCDAYLGDAGTSVTALFGVVGKPMYILNNRLSSPPEEDDWKAWVSQPLRSDGNNRYSIVLGNRVFIKESDRYHYKYLCDISMEYYGGGYYSRALESAGSIVVLPYNAEHILIVDTADFSKRRIDLKHETNRNGAFAGNYTYPLEEQDIYWLLPNRYSSLIRFNALTGKVDYFIDEAFSDEFAVQVDFAQRRIVAARWIFETKYYYYNEIEGTAVGVNEVEISVPGMKMTGRRMLCLNREGTRLRAIDLITGEKEEREVHFNGLYTSALWDTNNMDVLWFLPYEGTSLGKWRLSTDEWETVDVSIEGLYSLQRPDGSPCNIFYFTNGVFFNDKLILSPNWGTKFVELDVNTHQAKEWNPPFPYSIKDKNDYWINSSIGYFYRDLKTGEYFFFYAPEHITYAIDLAKGTCYEVEVTFDKEEIKGMAYGFHKDSQWMPYCCFEDVFNSLEDIASGRTNGMPFEHKSQIEAYRAVNASPQGDCGKKVHGFMRKNCYL